MHFASRLQAPTPSMARFLRLTIATGVRIETHKGCKYKYITDCKYKYTRNCKYKQNGDCKYTHSNNELKKRGAEKLRTTEKALITLDLRKSLENYL